MVPVLKTALSSLITRANAASTSRLLVRITLPPRARPSTLAKAGYLARFGAPSICHLVRLRPWRALKSWRRPRHLKCIPDNTTNPVHRLRSRPLLPLGPHSPNVEPHPAAQIIEVRLEISGHAFATRRLRTTFTPLRIAIASPGAHRLTKRTNLPFVGIIASCHSASCADGTSAMREQLS
jgi:hypothetical protein